MPSIAASAVTTVLEKGSIKNCALIAGAALIFFDYAITFGQEVQLFWGERSFSAWLFFANRMLALVYASSSVWSVMVFQVHTVTSCVAYSVSISVVFRLIVVISDVVAILRVYAVTGGDRRYVLLLALMMVFRVASDIYIESYEAQASHFLVVLARTSICIIRSRALSSAKDIFKKLDIASEVLAIAATVTTLAILWRKLYVDHGLAATDLPFTKNPSLSAVLFRDGTIEMITLLLVYLLKAVLRFVNSIAEDVIGHLEYSLILVLISHILLNVRATSRSTRGEQSQTPSFVRSRRGVQTQADVENMSFESNVLGSTEQASESDCFHPQDSIKHTRDGVLTADHAHQNVHEEERMDDVEEEEMLSDWEDDE